MAAFQKLQPCEEVNLTLNKLRDRKTIRKRDLRQALQPQFLDKIFRKLFEKSGTNKMSKTYKNLKVLSGKTQVKAL